MGTLRAASSNSGPDSGGSAYVSFDDIITLSTPIMNLTLDVGSLSALNSEATAQIQFLIEIGGTQAFEFFAIQQGGNGDYVADGLGVSDQGLSVPSRLSYTLNLGGLGPMPIRFSLSTQTVCSNVADVNCFARAMADQSVFLGIPDPYISQNGNVYAGPPIGVPVPEPASLALVAGSAGVLVLLRRKRLSAH